MTMILNDDKTDPNKILPIEYDWAREYYRAGVDNNWVPEEIPMAHALTTRHASTSWKLAPS